jgi:hypothetical protein
VYANGQFSITIQVHNDQSGKRQARSNASDISKKAEQSLLLIAGLRLSGLTNRAGYIWIEDYTDPTQSTKIELRFKVASIANEHFIHLQNVTKGTYYVLDASDRGMSIDINKKVKEYTAVPSRVVVTVSKQNSRALTLDPMEVGIKEFDSPVMGGDLVDPHVLADWAKVPTEDQSTWIFDVVIPVGGSIRVDKVKSVEKPEMLAVAAELHVKEPMVEASYNSGDDECIYILLLIFKTTRILSWRKGKLQALRLRVLRIAELLLERKYRLVLLWMLKEMYIFRIALMS